MQPNTGASLTNQSLFGDTRRRIGSRDAYQRFTYRVYDENDYLTRTVRETVPGSLDALLGLGGGIPSQQQLAERSSRDGSVNAGYLITDGESMAKRTNTEDHRWQGYSLGR